ncbi:MULTISPECIES: RibD family protein [unclassified Halomonas]|uniref:RibD family protein n=1 Tax=unclassified Halomonas TaxID=2609666 RepID=UPI001EF496A8|nr:MULTISPECIES: RibD family protein [unclassified Halomonas]MCG7576655.1 RibD family protein [Halomonas sp. MMH1-48]MCG7603718.1 RibD family protein [Halomonas sp. MM17-34]MCG7612810.1 RibD family protein [Halomonas sp. MM17-29]MCG7619569.1 RibD family protein [Halomonas sp. DSH1-27]
MPDSSNTSHSIDLDTAWQWLLAQSDGTSIKADLSVTRDGAWQSPHAVTPQAQTALDCLTPLALQPRWVVAQLGQSLDGRIATESGHSHYINGHESIVHLHRLRALADAVVVGAGTAAADNPQLTVRHVTGRHPTRVVLDPRGRVPGHLALFRSSEVKTLHITGPDVTTAPSHAEHCVLALNAHGQFDPAKVITLLAERGLTRVLVEGGGVTISQFIEAYCVDRLHLMVAPLLIGSGRPGLQMTPIETLESALRPTMRSFRCGDDTLFDVMLRDV